MANFPYCDSGSSLGAGSVEGRHDAKAADGLSGTIEVDGETIKWDRNSGHGLAIEFPWKSDKETGSRIHIGGDPDAERFRAAIAVFRMGYRKGREDGAWVVRHDMRKAMGIV